MISKVCSAIAAFFLWTMTGTFAHAVVVTTGCADPNACTLEELMAGGTIQVNDKLFENFSFISTGSNVAISPADPALITVVGNDSEVGIFLRNDAGTLNVGNIGTQTSRLQYDVTVLDASSASVGAELAFRGLAEPVVALRAFGVRSKFRAPSPIRARG